MANFNEDYAKEGLTSPNYRTRARLLSIDVCAQFIIFDYEQKKYPDDFYRQAELLVRLRQFTTIVLNGDRADAYSQAS